MNIKVLSKMLKQKTPRLGCLLKLYIEQYVNNLLITEAQLKHQLLRGFS